MSNEHKYSLTSINTLVECESFEFANKYLELGWIIISTHIRDDYGHPTQLRQKTIYCLGWSSVESPKYPIKQENVYGEF